MSVVSLAPVPGNSLFEQIALGLEASGIVVLPHALPDSIARCLVDFHLQLERSDFHEAAVGRETRTVNKEIRRDKIRWIEADDLSTATPWLAWTESLMVSLNRRLYLGLQTFESHLTLYEPGDFYRRHLDAFRGNASRMLSLVVYLNEDWAADAGGELVLYDPTGASGPVRIVPAFGTVALFLAREFPHEVLTSKRTRYSVSGWFRTSR